MRTEVVGHYLTRSGQTGAVITRTTSGDRVTYSYIGKWGAGSGLAVHDMGRHVKEWLTDKRGMQVILDFNERLK